MNRFTAIDHNRLLYKPAANTNPSARAQNSGNHNTPEINQQHSAPNHVDASYTSASTNALTAKGAPRRNSLMRTLMGKTKETDDSTQKIATETVGGILLTRAKKKLDRVDK